MDFLFLICKLSKIKIYIAAEFNAVKTRNTCTFKNIFLRPHSNMSIQFFFLSELKTRGIMDKYKGQRHQNISDLPLSCHLKWPGMEGKIVI